MRLADEYQDRASRLRVWIDAHPRTGWYIAVMSTLSVVLELGQLVVR